MKQYPKRILDVSQQLQSYIDAGMIVSSKDETISALQSIGYYRIRGYCYHLYDNATKKYKQGTAFVDVLKLYQFDTEFSHLLFSLSTSIEISLQVRLSEALLSVNHDALALLDPSLFSDKKLYWNNVGILSGEIARSNDVFIQHNFDNHDGMIPVWAAVEIMSFGNLSKTIKNLKTGNGSAASELLSHYHYMTVKGRSVNPSLQMFTSWTQAVSVLRNICAHNSRIYNRTINTHVQIPAVDAPLNHGRYNGVYQIILAMKYLRPSDEVWNEFISELVSLIFKYTTVIELKRINFPQDWLQHMSI